VVDGRGPTRSEAALARVSAGDHQSSGRGFEPGLIHTLDLPGRAAHAEPAAGRSLRRSTPPGLPGAPSQHLSTQDRGTGQSVDRSPKS
jgi:hypothetical protein